MTKRFLRFSAIFIIVALIVVGLAACSRSASKGPTPTSSGKPPVPGGKATDQTMGLFDGNATATAVAATSAVTTPGSIEEATKKAPAAVTATPEVAVVAAATPVPPAATQAVAVSTPVKPTTYTLQKGEFPYCIARRFNLNPSELLSMNGLGLNSQTFPGAVLRIPQTNGTFPGNRALLSHPTDYTVRSGDTIYSVACLYGDVSPEMIAQANSLSSPYTLTSGAKIRIP